jgi:Zn ribbon nucleic-acid-binding protein
LLSSWIVRLALGNGIKLHTFSKLYLPNIELWNRDIDKSASDDLIFLLSKYTKKNITDIFFSTLKSYESYLYECHIPNSHAKWILPLGIYHRKRLHNGLVLCPLCLKEDNVPYYRKEWRLAFNVICTKHKIRMIDKCINCNSVIAFHRNDFKNRNYATTSPITECYKCGFDLIQSPTEAENNSNFIDFISLLHTTLKNGFLILNDRFIYSHMYFEVLHQLFKILSLDRHGAKLRKIIESYSGITYKPNSSNKKIIELFPLANRINILYMLESLMQNWPDNFIQTCLKAGISKCRVERDFKYSPFWFQIVIDKLNKKNHSSSLEEIQTIINYLNKNNLLINKKSINKLLGKTDSKMVNYFFKNYKSQLNFKIKKFEQI